MPQGPQPIKIAILAMGGEGGGVLAKWLVDLAEHEGQLAQATSVPGVAQRTGATIYYVEIFPARAQGGRLPVLALMPLPGDVDIVLASELMEAARAVQRGLVTPDRTTLIASTHRVYAMAEKIALGDGRADAAALLDDARGAARRFIGYDMAAAAQAGGSVISAVLLGALAGAGVLPFERAQFEATIARGGVGMKPSLAAFAAAFERVAKGGEEPVAAGPVASQGVAAGAAPASLALSHSGHAEPQIRSLLARAAQWPGAVQPVLIEGLRRLVDYQDPAYAGSYLDRLHSVAGGSEEFGSELARHLALAMSYEDTIRVADLKTRASRFERVRAEVRAMPGQIVHIEEYLHPRLQEVAQTLPAALGRWLLRPGWPGALVQRLAERGRIVRTSSLPGYLLLAAVAGLRRWRRGTLRFALEQERIEQWLADIRAALPRDPALALEIVRCQRLVKGYGGTHERGLANYARLRQAWQRGAIDAGTLARLRDAALADEEGKALQGELQRLSLAA
jgi:indolepyruvate ferredoxin oxidoreductase beta subunit